MLNRSTPIVEESLRGLHPEQIDDPDQILALLERARRSGVTFHRGLNGQIDLETAQVESADAERMVLRAPNFDRGAKRQIFLNFELDARPYFFATRSLAPLRDSLLVVETPRTLYVSERRDRPRWAPDRQLGDPLRVEVHGSGGESLEGVVEDVSPDGLGIVVHGAPPAGRWEPLKVRFLDGRERGTETRLQLRSHRPAGEGKGWTRIGLVRSETAPKALIGFEDRARIIEDASVDGRATGRARPPAEPPEPRVLRFLNPKGEEIVGLLDSWGDPRGATAVIVPNGWGQTKEALLPLARTIVESFREQGEPVVVLRFDGVRKRGESYNDVECRVPGREHHHYVFSQGVDDIEAVVGFLKESPEFGASTVILVSFSAAAIEARRAVARDGGRNIDGWISVVGAPDIQSMTRSISGGVDFAAGYERGMRFGFQELLGVVVDIDRLAADSFAHEMTFIEDARRDLASIRVPISWFHGRYDGWIDFDRVRDILSHGETRDRKLVVMPTGHQLKTSKQAGEVFRCIAQEVGRMVLGRPIDGLEPETREVRWLRVGELRRLPHDGTDLQGFWRDYLVGRDRSLGIELLTSSSAYREMMTQQIEMLGLRAGQRVADLGSGTGSFELQLVRGSQCPPGLHVTSVDYVGEALRRARERLGAVEAGQDIGVAYVEADLDLVHAEQKIPLQGEHFDAVIASLLISYLERPELLLAEVARLLRPGGRLVISTLGHDADISRLYVESLAEHRIGVQSPDIPSLAPDELGAVARNFLNDAARILDLEQAGAFRFYEPEELIPLVAAAGFEEIETRDCLGSPSQAMILSARRR
jgi:ubiquinone/menaquinone biosynthesis C-methylase UbiE